MSSHEAASITDELSRILKTEGFEHFGVAELKTPISIAVYEEWLKKGYQGEMSYLVRHLPEKKDPSRVLARARTAIVITQNYVPHPDPAASWPLSSATRVASYARGRDYHHFLRGRLEAAAARLRERFPQDVFHTFTDSGPVLERDLAQRAGLGWIGKNTCLIHPKRGSLFFLGEIYTTLSIPVAELAIRDHCGTCTRCLDACPTGALQAPRELDARLCISYLTIESRKHPEPALRTKIGDWLFGCDICQTVCPWNLKVHGKEKIASLAPPPESRDSLIEDLRFLLTSSNRALEKAFLGTPLSRAGGVGLKRNALIVAANQNCHELRQEIQALLSHEKLAPLAEWALSKLSAPHP